MANYDTLPGAISDGSLSSGQFRIVQMSGSTSVNFEVALSTEATDHPIGICQNKPSSSGQAAEVAISGVAKLKFGGTIAQGGLIVCSSGGEGIADTTTAGNWVVAQALVNGTDCGVYPVKVLSPFRHST